MANYYDLPPGPEVPHIVNAVIEIPKGSAHKYEYDKDLNVFRLDRTLFSPVHYPGAYGFIPNTLAEDGDPLDVVVIIDGPTFTGCLIEVRPLGVLIMRDDKGLDHKVLAVPVADPRMREVHGLQHLPSHYLKEVDYFFNIYKELEGKKSDTYGWEDRVVAYQAITDSIQRLKDYENGLVDRVGVLTDKGRAAQAEAGVNSGPRTAAMEVLDPQELGDDDTGL
jgi:inorganic pyrophosphatase